MHTRAALHTQWLWIMQLSPWTKENHIFFHLWLKKNAKVFDINNRCINSMEKEKTLIYYHLWPKKDLRHQTTITYDMYKLNSKKIFITRYLRNIMHQHIFNARFECDRRARAATTSSLHSQFNYSSFSEEIKTMSFNWYYWVRPHKDKYK